MASEGGSFDSTRLIYALQRAFAAVEARKVAVLAELDLLPAHYGLLMNVRAHPGITGAELARLLGVTPQNVASLVARLIARGLLDRRTHDRHPHVLELHLTATGTQRLQRADRLVAGLEAEAVQAVGAADAAQLRLDLDRLRTGLAGRATTDGDPPAR